MSSPSNNYAVCHECDLTFELPAEVGDYVKIQCPRCKHKVITGHPNPMNTGLSIAFTSVLVLFASLSFSFLSFSSLGKSQSMTIVDISIQLYKDGFVFLSGMLPVFVVILPLIYLAALTLILLCVKFNRKTSTALYLGRLMHFISPWIMVEVFFLGVIVTLIKVISIVDISFGISFWAYALFTILFTYLSSLIDTHRLWHWIDQVKR